MLGEEFPKDEIQAIIDEVDINRDNCISYSEFLALWEERNEERRETMLHEIEVTMDDSASDVSAFSGYRDDLKENTMGRANFIEGKQLSRRKISAITD